MTEEDRIRSEIAELDYQIERCNESIEALNLSMLSAAAVALALTAAWFGGNTFLIYVSLGLCVYLIAVVSPAVERFMKHDRPS